MRAGTSQTTEPAAKGSGSNGDTVEHHRTDAHQAPILEGGTVNHSPVAHGHLLSNHDGLAWIAMQDGPVLHIAVRTDADGLQVPARNGRRPEAAARCHLHITDHHS